MDRNRRERTSPATNNQIFHRPEATNSPCEPSVLPRGDKIRSARDRSAGLAAAQAEYSDRCSSLSALGQLMRSSSISTRYGASQLQLHPVNDLLARDISRSLSVEYFSNTKNRGAYGARTRNLRRDRAAL